MNVDSPWTLECIDRRGAAAWTLVDETGDERLVQAGRKLVPGAGLRWQHKALAAGAAGGGSSVLSEADEDMLPWQVIAILDTETLREVLAGADAHKQRQAEERLTAPACGSAQRTAEARSEGAMLAAAAAAGDDRLGGGSDDEGERQELVALATEPDHYRVLGVSREAPDKAIVAAYRVASLKYHPDRRGGSTAAFQRVQLAYETLGDERRRAAYDAGEVDATGASTAYGARGDERWRREYWPFGDPFVHKRKLAAQREAERRKHVPRQ